jgi:dTDP-4-dehydrorhamnose reductase
MNSRIVILGTGGRLGAALLRHYRTDYSVIGFDRAQLDLADQEQLRDTLAAHDFDLLINCAAMTNVDGCEREPEQAFAINAEAPKVLAKLCARRKARLIHISTDYVFDGAKSDPYTEEDEANPISVYGGSKREGERRVLATGTNNLVVRLSWVFGPDRPSFIDWIIQQAREKEHVEAVADKFSTPSYTLDLAEMLRPLFERAVPGGIVHLANGGRCSWREYGQYALDCCEAEGLSLRARSVGAISLRDMKNFIAKRPVWTVLSTAKYERLTGQTPRHWHDAVRHYIRAHVAA